MLKHLIDKQPNILLQGLSDLCNNIGFLYITYKVNLKMNKSIKIMYKSNCALKVQCPVKCAMLVKQMISINHGRSS